jgi:hypothetical protein
MVFFRGHGDCGRIDIRDGVHIAGSIATKLAAGELKVTVSWNSSPRLASAGKSPPRLTSCAPTISPRAKTASKLVISKTNNAIPPALGKFCFVLVLPPFL